MPAGSQAVRILLQLNRACRDLSWLLKNEHYAELRQPGHFDVIDAACAAWAGVDELMARHIEADMLLESREAIRAAVVTAAENGLPLRWEIGGSLGHAKVVTARVLGGTVTLFLPHVATDAAAVPSGGIPA
jgi:hypothetical protein